VDLRLVAIFALHVILHVKLASRQALQDVLLVILEQELIFIKLMLPMLFAQQIVHFMENYFQDQLV
jgi:hypothetical protein